MNDKVQLAEQYVKMAREEYELSHLASAQALAAISTAISTAHIAEAVADRENQFDQIIALLENIAKKGTK